MGWAGEPTARAGTMPPPGEEGWLRLEGHVKSFAEAGKRVPKTERLASKAWRQESLQKGEQKVLAHVSPGCQPWQVREPAGRKPPLTGNALMRRKGLRVVWTQQIGRAHV